VLPEAQLRNTLGDLECSRVCVRVEGDNNLNEVTRARNSELESAR
jgi:hypothetical protein